MIRRTLDEIRQRAVHELCTNDTITVYTMVDDYEWRRPPMYAQLRLAVDYTIDSIASLVLGINDFSRSLNRAIGGAS